MNELAMWDESDDQCGGNLRQQFEVDDVMCDEVSDRNTILTSAGSSCANANTSNVMMPMSIQIFHKDLTGVGGERSGRVGRD